MTTIAAYVMAHYGASPSVAGFTASLYIVGALVSRLFAGRYIELIGRKRLVYTGLVFFLLMCSLYLPAAGLPLLMAVRFLHGCAFGINHTAMSTVMMAMVPAARRGEGTGIYLLSTNLATAVGPFIGLLFLNRFPYPMIFLVCIASAAISLALMIPVRIPETARSEEDLAHLRMVVRHGGFVEKKALPISIFMIVLAACYSGVVSFLGPYAIHLSLTDVASSYFIVYAAVLFVSRPITGRMLDRYGDNIVIYPALVAFFLSFAALTWADQALFFLVSAVFLALGNGTIMSAGQAIAVNLAPSHSMGLATATFYIFCDVGMGIGPLLLGLLIPELGFRGMYMSLALLVGLAAVMYYFLHGKYAAARRQDATARH